MNLFRKNSKYVICLIKTVLIILICIPLVITIIRFDAWKMIVYLLFWIICPGMFIEEYILKQERKDAGIFILSSFFMGMALVIAEWFPLYVLGARRALLFINPCISAIFLLCLLRKVRKKEQIERKRSFSIDLHFLIPFCIATYLCAYYLNFRMPQPVTGVSVDYTWQIGNINQFASDIPLRDIRVAGVKVRYHFFTTLFLGIAKYILGGEGWVYFAQYTIWFLPMLLTISLRKLYGRAIQNHYGVTLMTITTMIGFSLNSSYGAWQYALHSNVNSVGLAISCLILLFLHLEKAEEYFSVKHRMRREQLFWMLKQLVLLFLLTGIKGPFAMLYVLAVSVWVIILFMKRKIRDWKVFVFVLANIFVFAIIFGILLATGTQGYFSGGGVASILQSAVDGRELASLYEKSGFHNIPGRAVFLLPSLVAVFTFLTPFAILELVDLFGYLCGQKEWKWEELFACILAGGGLCAYYLFHVVGNSQLYFLFSAIPFVGYLGSHKAFAVLKGVGKNVFCGIILLAAVYGLYANSLATKIPVKMAESALQYISGSYLREENGRIFAFQAYDYLRNHTDKNALIATNNQNRTFHEISAFAERRCYIEGYEYSERNFGFSDAEKRLWEMSDLLFAGSWVADEDRFGFCEEYQIDYLVLFRDKGEQAVAPLMESYHFVCVYENAEILIFKVER